MDLKNIIPNEFRNLITINQSLVPSESSDVLLALKEALEIIRPKIRVNKRYCIFIDKFPVKIPVPPDGGHIIYSPSEKEKEYIGFVYDDNIFIDYSQILIYPFHVQVALILEELVHALMNVTDEIFVKEIVCYLCPGIVSVNGEYYYASDHKN